jgi:hypothetical protein
VIKAVVLLARKEHQLKLELHPPPPQAPKQAKVTGQPAPRKTRLWTWIAAGAAGAATALALGFGITAHLSHTEYKDAASAGEIERYYDLQDKVSKHALAANVSLGIAAAFAATAVVLFFVEGRERPSQGSPTKAHIGPGQLVVTHEF